jgi:hypothetical protein
MAEPYGGGGGLWELWGLWEQEGLGELDGFWEQGGGGVALSFFSLLGCVGLAAMALQGNRRWRWVMVGMGVFVRIVHKRSEIGGRRSAELLKMLYFCSLFFRRTK